jgi:hypothetical protein
MPLQITPQGVRVLSDEERRRLAEAFHETHCVRLPGLLHPTLLARLKARLAAADAWAANVHHLVNGPSTELVFSDQVTVGLLAALFNDRALFAEIERITGSEAIRSYAGRIYRMDAGAHADVWHTDANGDYMVGLSLNLTDGVFEGGALHLREYGSKRVRAEVANTGQGDAVVFRIDGGLEHIVAPVTGGVPKIAWAGWFCRQPLMPELDLVAGMARGEERG